MKDRDFECFECMDEVKLWKMKNLKTTRKPLLQRKTLRLPSKRQELKKRWNLKIVRKGQQIYNHPWSDGERK